jgi:hypothetical protein
MGSRDRASTSSSTARRHRSHGEHRPVPSPDVRRHPGLRPARRHVRGNDVGAGRRCVMGKHSQLGPIDPQQPMMPYGTPC